MSAIYAAYDLDSHDPDARSGHRTIRPGGSRGCCAPGNDGWRLHGANVPDGYPTDNPTNDPADVAAYSQQCIPGSLHNTQSHSALH